MPPAANSSDRALVIVTTELRGSIAPCGCTSEPLGGIARFAALVEDKRRAFKDPLIVSAGNFLFDTGSLAGPKRAQEEDKAALLASVYRALGVFAQGFGAFDLAHTDGAFARAQPNPWLDSGAWRVGESAGLRIAVVALGPAEVDPAAITATKPQKADAYLALSAFDWQTSRTRARSVPFLDVIISSGGGEPHAPVQVGETLLVDAGEQGQRVGLLELVKGDGQRFAFYDGGANALAQSKRQLVAIERELAQKDLNPSAHAMRADRRDALAREIGELQAHPPALPTSKYLRFFTVALTKRSPESAKVAERVRAYNETLCALSATATASLPCPQAPEGAPRFVGAEACGACHPAALAQWKTQKHAHAVKTLEAAGKFCDLACIGCHTTGFGTPGGFCSPQKVGVLKEVGCEMCHGAGSLHAGAPAKTNIKRSPGADTCTLCHSKEHSDLFEFESYRARILGRGHGQKL